MFTIPTAAEVAAVLKSRGLAGAEAAGFHSRVDAIEANPGNRGTTIDGQPFGEIWTDLNARLALFNRNANRMVALLSRTTTRAQDRVAVPFTPEFEAATEFGRPGKIRSKTVFRGFPLRHYDLGYGFTQEFLDDSVASEIRATQTQAEAAWWALQMRTVMDALFDNTPAPSNEGITVLPLYNADGEVPPNYRRYRFDGNHTHYLAINTLTLAESHLNTMETHLIHHGFGDPSLGGDGATILLHANRAQMPTIRNFPSFVPAVTSFTPEVVDGQIVGQTRAGAYGLSAQGYIGTMVVVENNEIPAGYLLATATGGLFSPQNPVGLRVHENPSARGLRLIEGNNQRYPLIESVYDGYMGAGVRQRGAAVVLQIVNSSSYTPPNLVAGELVVG